MIIAAIPKRGSVAFMDKVLALLCDHVESSSFQKAIATHKVLAANLREPSRSED